MANSVIIQSVAIWWLLRGADSSHAGSSMKRHPSGFFIFQSCASVSNMRQILYILRKVERVCVCACLRASCYGTISIVTVQSSKRALSTSRPVDANVLGRRVCLEGKHALVYRLLSSEVKYYPRLRRGAGSITRRSRRKGGRRPKLTGGR